MKARQYVKGVALFLLALILVMTGVGQAEIPQFQKCWIIVSVVFASMSLTEALKCFGIDVESWLDRRLP